MYLSSVYYNGRTPNKRKLVFKSVSKYFFNFFNFFIELCIKLLFWIFKRRTVSVKISFLSFGIGQCNFLIFRKFWCTLIVTVDKSAEYRFSNLNFFYKPIGERVLLPDPQTSTIPFILGMQKDLCRRLVTPVFYINVKQKKDSSRRSLHVARSVLCDITNKHGETHL